MRSQNTFLLNVAMAALMSGLCLFASENNKHVSVGLLDLRKNISAVQTQISSTIQSLEELKLSARNRGDIKQSHAAFEKQFKALESQIEDLRAHGLQMRARSEDYYKTWQTQLIQMQNPKLRDKAQNRYDDAREEFEKIVVNADEAKRDLAPFMADLRDIHNYLKADLSLDSVKSLNNTIWKLGNKSAGVIGSLRHVNEQISKTLELQPEN